MAQATLASVVKAAVPSRTVRNRRGQFVKLNYVYLRPSHLIDFREVGPYRRSAAEAWVLMFDWLDRNCLRG